ncbi:MAG: FHA domain-containing protein [Nitrospirae bacterium]|nr:FHA domain-containing protein [Nitrospirota bacterium]
MIKEVFSEGHVLLKDKRYTAEVFNLITDEINRADGLFTGILKIDEPEAAYFLFCLMGDAYAAGFISNSRPVNLSIKDFLKDISSDKKQSMISLYKTDPVLFKGMLVFFQKEPSSRVTTDIIDLENILMKIKNESISAFIVLRKNNMHNFFYIHSGEPKMAHFADTAVRQDEKSVREQMLFYAYPSDKTLVDVLVYSDITTLEADDSCAISSLIAANPVKSEDAVTPLQPTQAEQQPKIQPAEKGPKRIRIEITGGPQKGNKFNIPLPFTIGRRDADVRIRDMTVSKRHALFEVSGNQIILRDLDSINGIFVNGREVKEVVLSSGDIIQMGDTTLKIHFVSD